MRHITGPSASAQVRVFFQQRLGNQLFEFAAGLAAAIRLEVPLVLDLRHLRCEETNFDLPKVLDLARARHPIIVANAVADLAHGELPTFTTAERPSLVATMLGRANGAALKYSSKFGWVERSSYKEPAPFCPDAGWERLSAPLTVTGWMQHPTYFAGAETELAHLFRVPVEPPAADGTVTVNMRLDIDYLHRTWQVPVEWYTRALNHLWADEPIEQIEVISDVHPLPDEYQRALTEFAPVVHPSGGGLVDHLGRLSSARRLIGTNSTFSWWGAWLGTARRQSECVIFPSAWIPSMAPPPRTFFLPEWKVVA